MATYRHEFGSDEAQTAQDIATTAHRLRSRKRLFRASGIYDKEIAPHIQDGDRQAMRRYKALIVETIAGSLPLDAGETV